jgi:hypothetical protein
MSSCPINRQAIHTTASRFGERPFIRDDGKARAARVSGWYAISGVYSKFDEHPLDDIVQYAMSNCKRVLEPTCWFRASNLADG